MVICFHFLNLLFWSGWYLHNDIEKLGFLFYVIFYVSVCVVEFYHFIWDWLLLKCAIVDISQIYVLCILVITVSHPHAHTCMHIHTCTRMHAHTHMHTHAYTYTHITYAQTHMHTVLGRKYYYLSHTRCASFFARSTKHLFL